MSEENPTTAAPDTEADSSPTRVYVAEVFGKTFAIRAGGHGAVRAHIVRRLRDEIEIRVGSFADGWNHANHGIKVEVAGEGENAELFPAGGDS